MSRRRLRLNNYSSDEDPQPDIQHSSSSLQPHPSPSHFHPNISDPLPISDDDEPLHFIDVSDHLSPPSPDSDQSPEVDQPTSSIPSNESSGSPITSFLQSLGLNFKTDWFNACLHDLEISVPGFSNLNINEKGKLCFEKFLVSDMNYSGAGVLPENVHSMHLVNLPGPYVLQVDEIVNISCPLKGRYQTAPPGIKRCLKLSLTDGVQRIFAMEYMPIKDLQVLAPAGLKVVICNVSVRHGLLMLVPETVEVLGGLVEELDAARLRMVEEVNKPPRGRRTRTGVVPSLASRATLAAWTLNDASEPEHPNVSVGNEPNHSNQGVDTLPRENEAFTVPVGRENVDFERSNFVSSAEEIHTSSIPYGSHSIPVGGANVVSERSSNFASSIEEIHTSSIPYGSHSIPVGRANVDTERSSNFVSSVEEIHTHSVPYGSHSIPVGGANVDSNFVSSVDEIYTHSIPSRRASTEPNISFDSVLTADDTNMVDIEHPLMLSGEREIPFTYMASLSTKLAAMKEESPSVYGKIKCFLTGIKGFQFNHRTTYELRAYVDDGSLISEVLIDHQVVQKLIGHPPKDVTTAIASSDIKVVSDMKETMRRFQVFLANFEGTMLIEMNRTYVPLVHDMNLGCSESDAQSLLRRIKCSRAGRCQTKKDTPPLDPIDVSP